MILQHLRRRYCLVVIYPSLAYEYVELIRILQLYMTYDKIIKDERIMQGYRSEYTMLIQLLNQTFVRLAIFKVRE